MYDTIFLCISEADIAVKQSWSHVVKNRLQWASIFRSGCYILCFVFICFSL